MSRIGKQPIDVPSGVKVELEGQCVKATGTLGTLELSVNEAISVTIDGNVIQASRKGDSKTEKQLHGLTRTLIANMLAGVDKGFEKELEIVGVGYKAELVKNTLTLALGYSHSMIYPLPEGISAVVSRPTNIVIKGADKQKVGQVAADIRAMRPPEPYKGKGVKYANETILRKAGKAGKAGA